MTSAQYDEIVQALTDYNVKLTDANGELRGTYEIFEDLAKAWGNMTSMERSSLAKTLAGNRQQNVFFSLMDQFNEAEKAMKSIESSSGALSEAYGEYMNSITAHVNQFKAAYTTLADTVVNNDLAKFVVDSGRGVLTFLNSLINALGSVNTLILAIGTAKGIMEIISTIKRIKSEEGAVLSVVNVLSGAFPNLSSAIKGVSTMMRDGASASAVLEAGLEGVLGIIEAHPVVSSIVAATIAVTAFIKILDVCTESFEEAQEKAANSRKEYEKTVSELESLNSQLDSNKGKIDELRRQGPLTVVTQAELDKLEKENQLLEAQIKLKQQLKEREEKQAASDANNVLTKKQQYGGAALDYSEVGDWQQFDIVELTTKLQTQLNKAQAEYNKLLVEQGKIDPDSQRYRELEKQKSMYSNIIDSLNREVTNKLSIISDNYNSLFDSDGAVISGYEDMVERIDALTAFVSSNSTALFGDIVEKYSDVTNSLKELGEQGKVTAEDLKADEYKGFIENLIEVGLIADDTDSSLELVAAAFNSMGEEVKTAAEELTQYSDSYTDLQSALESFTSYQTAVNDAISASASATGLSQEQIDNLTRAYKDLEGFDAARLFEVTADGVRLNAEELERLNNEYENNSVEAFTKRLRELQKEIYAGRAQGADTSALEEEYRATSLLKSQYEGLTSAYNKWLKAKSGSNNRDTYQSIGAGYKEMKEILEGGWYGDDDLNAYLDLMLSASQRTGDTIRDFEQLNKTIEGTSHSIMDYWKSDGSTDGIFDFLDDVRAKFGDTYATIAEDGTYSFDLTGDKLQEVADAFGMSTDLVRYFAQALIDAGAKVDLFDLSLEQEINNARESLKEFQKEGKLSEGLNLEFNVETDSLDSVKKTIEELERERLTIDGETDPGLLRQLNSLIAKTKEQYYIRLNAETDGSLDEAARLLNQIYEKTNGTYTIDTKTRNGKDVENLVKKISELPEETQIAIGIEVPNVGDIDAIISQFNADGKTPKIPVEFKPETKETDDYLSHVQELTIDDKEFKVKAIDKSTSVIKGIINLLKDVKNKEVTVTTKYKYSYSSTSSSSSSGNSSGKMVPLPKAKGTLLTPSRARADGSAYNLFNLKAAYANGEVALSEDEQALVNELGTESIIRDGRWFLIPGGVHQEALKKGDIILSAAQTKALLKTGAAAGHGRSYAYGTALGAYASGLSGSGASRRPIGGYSNSGSKTTKNTVSQSTAKKSTSNKTSDEESEFERLYKYHQHLLDMDAESVEDYLNWLNDAYKTAYKNNEIELDDYYKYEAEVYKGLQDLFKDYLNDIEHEISMRENFKGEAKTIVKLYQQMIDAVQAEIKAARAAGLRDTDDYIQDLQDKYWDYYNAIKDLREDTTESAKNAVDKLVDYRIDMLKKEADKEKDSIQERLSYLRDFYQKQKDLLRDAYDEDKYYEEQAEKRKAVADIQAELNKLEYDNSAWAQKRKLQLMEDLAEAQKNLNDFEKDHALDVAQEQLDKQLEMQEKELDAETDAIEKRNESAKELYERALADIRNGSVKLYEEMIEYNNIYGLINGSHTKRLVCTTTHICGDPLKPQTKTES